MLHKTTSDRSNRGTKANKAIRGIVQKLKPKFAEIIQYNLLIDHEEFQLNDLLGNTLAISFKNRIVCIACQRKIKKSYNQGYCFPCSQGLARCDLCIVRPEKCHHHLGTCREPEWALNHCMIPHIIYLANTSGVKIGITRENHLIHRWMDQGAVQGLAIARVKNRHQAGLVEVELAKQLNDKTNWRKMLKGEVEVLNLAEIRDGLWDHFSIFNIGSFSIERLLDEKETRFQYPILDDMQKVSKINSINFDKTPNFSGKLIGMKGQYLIFDAGVINMRSLTGYEMEIAVVEKTISTNLCV